MDDNDSLQRYKLLSQQLLNLMQKNVKPELNAKMLLGGEEETETLVPNERLATAYKLSSSVSLTSVPCLSFEIGRAHV